MASNALTHQVQHAERSLRYCQSEENVECEVGPAMKGDAKCEEPQDGYAGGCEVGLETLIVRGIRDIAIPNADATTESLRGSRRSSATTAKERTGR